MRRIDDMLKYISLDGLKGGNSMDDMQIKGIIPEGENTPKITQRKKAAAVKSRAPGVIAAALALVLGGAALVFTLTRSKPGTSASVSDSPVFTAAADADALNIYKLINANLGARIADGRILDEIKTGEYTADLSSPDKQTARLLSLTYEGNPQTVNVFKSSTSGIGELPKSGEIFYHINSRTYVIDFLQYRDTDGYMGQYPNDGVKRTAFGIIPENLGSINSYEPSEREIENNSTAKELCELVGKMLDDSIRGDFPNNQYHFFLPSGSGIILDFDKREQYADLIYRIEQYRTAEIKLTGKVFFAYDSNYEPLFLEWTDGNGVQLWPLYNGGTVEEFGRVPTGEGCTQVGADGRYFYCEKNCIGEFSSGSAVSREKMPEVFTWYEKFLAAGHEPVAFDAARLKAMQKSDKAVRFSWYDTVRNEYVNIRTSDMEGANIYVNGRYYNVEDTSVLDLLDNGMPEAVS